MVQNILYMQKIISSVITSNNTFSNQVQKAKIETIKISSITNTTAPIVEGAEFTAILTKYVKYYGSFDEALKHLNEYSKDEYSVFKTSSNGHGTATFSLYKLNITTNEWEKVSCKVGKKSYDTWTTDENATAYTETKLDAGTYKVDEI